ncbi:LysR family transcriptional regulator [Photobacterium atrarenae]|uniref:LysR family transcriptional regulator n=1 Tax=Photobacterium atrarenae TaxID=865757 RepID=A0ABY5GQE0_9GAMM|nr:LysR family transcriptional regulator [Photobacterium atrarenae]UTV30732.1 LysR family transcriptional regulator [Photobacterium atrarenae]
MAKKTINHLSHSELRLLNIFKVVAENNGITSAQEILSKNKATISIALSDLETRLGFSLCQRGRAGFKLTPEGEVVFRSYLSLHDSIINFTNAVNSIDESTHGSLSIYIDDNFINHQKMRITDTLKKLSQKFPNINIYLAMGCSTKAKEKLVNDEVDITVMQKTSMDTGLIYTELYKEKEYLYASSHHHIFRRSHIDLSTAEIMQLPTVQSSYSYCVNWDKYNTKATTDDKEATAFLILTDEFTGFLPSFYAKQWVDAGRMKALKPQELNNSIDYCVAVKPSRTNELLIKIWLDCFNSIIEQEQPCLLS